MLGLGTICANQVTQRLLCGSGMCSQSITGAGSGLPFNFWTTSGDANVQCNTCAATTLTETVANPNVRYAGTVTLNLGTLMPVAVHTFVNWSTGWHAGNVSICGGPSGTCNTYTNGAQAQLYKNSSYTLTGVNLPPTGAVSQWVTTAGSLSNQQPFSVSLATSSNSTAVVFMIVSLVSQNWDGYVLGPWASGSPSSITSAAGDFIAPNNNTGYPLGYWVGIGGIGGTGSKLWQAGIENYVNNTVSGWAPFYEEAGSCAGCNTPILLAGAGVIAQGDTVRVEITSSAGVSTCSVQDLTTGVSWPKSVSFTATTDSAEWIGETPNTSTFVQPIQFYHLEANSTFPPLTSDFLNFSLPAGYGTILPLTWVQANGWLEFKIER
jgi:hypothetical protein